MEQSVLLSVGLPVSLFLIMVGMGLTLTLRDFKAASTAPWPLTFGTILQVALLPIIALGIGLLLSLTPVMTVGLVLIAACPGGSTSNLFAFLGRGDVALSIILTVVASVVTIVTLPFFVNMAMSWVMDETVAFQLPVLKTIATLVAIIVVPVALGMLIRHYAPAFSLKAEKGVSAFGFIVMVVVILALVLQVGEGVGLMIRDAGLAAALLNIIGIVLGLGGGRLLGLTRQQAFTVAVELGIKNGTLGLMVAVTLLNSPEMSVASAVYSVLMFAFGVLMIGYGRATGVGGNVKNV